MALQDSIPTWLLLATFSKPPRRNLSHQLPPTLCWIQCQGVKFGLPCLKPDDLCTHVQPHEPRVCLHKTQTPARSNWLCPCNRILHSQIFVRPGTGNLYIYRTHISSSFRQQALLLILSFGRCQEDSWSILQLKCSAFSIAGRPPASLANSAAQRVCRLANC